MSQPLVQITKGDLHLILDITSLLGETAAPQQPKAATYVAPKVPTTKRTAPVQQPKAAAVKPKASAKPKRAKRTAKPSGAPTYQQIRELCSQGRHDEAVSLVPANWPHVVASIEAHRAKHGNGVAVAPKPKASPPQSRKAPIGSGRKPKASTKAATKVATCDKHIGVILTPTGCPICREPEAPKPTPKPKASPVKQQPKAATPQANKLAAAKAKAAKAAAKRAIGASKAPRGNKPQAFPPSVVTEADLVLGWAALAAQGHADVLRTAHQATAEAFGLAVRDGSKAEAAKQLARLRNLDNLLQQVG